MPRIFIPGEVPSLKNSKVKAAHGIFPSKAVTKYLQFLGIRSYGKDGVKGYKDLGRINKFAACVEPMRDYPFEQPHPLGLMFARKTRRDYDWINAAQIILDLLVAHGIFPDDSIKYIVPTPFSYKEPGTGKLLWTMHNTQTPGVWIDY